MTETFIKSTWVAVMTGAGAVDCDVQIFASHIDGQDIIKAVVSEAYTRCGDLIQGLGAHFSVDELENIETHISFVVGADIIEL